MQQPQNQSAVPTVTHMQQSHILGHNQQPAVQPMLPLQQQQQQHSTNDDINSPSFSAGALHSANALDQTTANVPHGTSSNIQKVQSQAQAILPNNTAMVATLAMSSNESESAATLSSMPTQQALSLAPTNTKTTTTTTTATQSSTTTIGESEERRQRRLARNRESARLSRRRKKEHLANLGDRVER
eukprot:CAMPEP_0185727416 /NCGR_PEP_ID=MMETSP1171-20130828/3117_1 /TAXON_ID=374046 /ORGANISM="Helicotheca tamensis, Strain CCMP826" /LENGTH=185 /DNA_ID=CAMNT_0028395985 /DNA_START=18 /DNA_END=571 /DNA_ORIENTATION=-